MNIKSETCHKLLRGIMANKTVAAILVAGVMFLSSCASPPNAILPTYVDPLQYEQYDCSQIGTEMVRVTGELNQSYRECKSHSNRDGWFMIGAVLVSGPLAIVPAVISDSESTERFAQLQGELEALEQASILKECDKRMLPDIPEFRKEFSSFTNKRSRVFHRYECQRRNEDTLEYKSTKEARDAGGKPCIHCKPSDMTKTEERLKKGR